MVQITVDYLSLGTWRLLCWGKKKQVACSGLVQLSSRKQIQQRSGPAHGETYRQGTVLSKTSSEKHKDLSVPPERQRYSASWDPKPYCSSTVAWGRLYLTGCSNLRCVQHAASLRVITDVTDERRTALGLGGEWQLVLVLHDEKENTVHYLCRYCVVLTWKLMPNRKDLEKSATVCISAGSFMKVHMYKCEIAP